jgi:Domain of unknown function (DUF4190)
MNDTYTRETDGEAIAALVLGVLSFVVLPFVAGVLAVVFGGRARRRIHASGGTLAGEGLATGGWILGWINVAMSLFVVLLIVAFAVPWAVHSAHLPVIDQVVVPSATLGVLPGS